MSESTHNCARCGPTAVHKTMPLMDGTPVLACLTCGHIDTEATWNERATKHAHSTVARTLTADQVESHQEPGERPMTGTIIPERLEKLNDITLSHGSHKSPDEGMCVMEAAAWIAGEDWTDHPACVSPMLAALCRLLNDVWDDEGRQRLKPFVARAVGTAGDGQDEARPYMALDWLVRTHTPTWLDLAGLREEATELREHRRIVDQETAAAAWGSIETARQSASAGGAATLGVAAWSAAWVGVQAAWNAWDAAWAAWDAWDAAWAAAWAAAEAAIEAPPTPTVHHLQASVLDLLDRMIDPRASMASRTDEEAAR